MGENWHNKIISGKEKLSLNINEASFVREKRQGSYSQEVWADKAIIDKESFSLAFLVPSLALNLGFVVWGILFLTGWKVQNLSQLTIRF